MERTIRSPKPYTYTNHDTPYFHPTHTLFYTRLTLETSSSLFLSCKCVSMYTIQIHIMQQVMIIYITYIYIYTVWNRKAVWLSDRCVQIAKSSWTHCQHLTRFSVCVSKRLITFPVKQMCLNPTHHLISQTVTHISIITFICGACNGKVRLFGIGI